MSFPFAGKLSAVFKPVTGVMLIMMTLTAGFFASMWLLMQPLITFEPGVRKAVENYDPDHPVAYSTPQFLVFIEVMFFMLIAMFVAQKLYWRLVAPRDLRQVVTLANRLIALSAFIGTAVVVVVIFNILIRKDVLEFGSIEEFRPHLADDLIPDHYRQMFMQSIYTLCIAGQLAILLGAAMQWHVTKLLFCFDHPGSKLGFWSRRWDIETTVANKVDVVDVDLDDEPTVARLHVV